MELERLSRAELAVLGREWLLHGHLQDRVGMPLVHSGRPREEMEQIAIDEWMAASPVYSRRMQRALRFAGGDVPTIFKNIQLDIGAPHQFLDFRCEVHDRNHGEFRLAHCGALMDVEPMGEEYVRGMCHTIEDPTFDATAIATNPRARIRPVHRPPRVPADREPHCHWTVTIDPEAPEVAPHPNLARVAASRIANVAVDVPAAGGEPGGWPDYSGPFDPYFQLEDLSHAALVVVLQEIAVQSHLLLRAFLVAVGSRYGDDVALDMVPTIFSGLAGLTAQRIRRAMGIEGNGADAIASLLGLHPVFWPRTYVDLSVEAVGGERVRFAFGDCDAFDEGDRFTWLAHLGGNGDRALDAIVWAIDPRARCEAVARRPGERLAYEAFVDDGAPARLEPPEIGLAKISTGAGFEFEQRRPVRV